jgi:hypothetical protein
MAVQVFALAFVVWNAVTGIKLDAASDKHGEIQGKFSR